MKPLICMHPGCGCNPDLSSYSLLISKIITYHTTNRYINGHFMIHNNTVKLNTFANNAIWTIVLIQLITK